MFMTIPKISGLQFELAFNRLVALVISVISLPFILRNCGTEFYGLYILLCSVSFLLSIADFGIGNGLISILAQASANLDENEFKKTLINSIFIGTLIVLVLPPLLFLIMNAFNWVSLINIDMSGDDSRSALVVVLLGASLNLLGSIGLKVLLANSHNRIFSRVQLLIALSTNTGLVVTSKLSNPTNGMLFSTLVLPHLIGILALFISLRLEHRNWFSFSGVSLVQIRKLIFSGRVYFFLQIAAIVNYQVDTLIIAHYLGKSNLAEYNVVLKISSVPYVLVSAAVLPIWASTSRLYSRGQQQVALDNLFKVLEKVLIISCACMILFGLFGVTFIKLWTFQQIQPSIQLVIANAIWIPFSCVMQLCAMYLNGSMAHRFLVYSTLLFTIGNLTFAIGFLEIFNNIAGPMWSNSISSLLFFIFPTLKLIKSQRKFGGGP